MEKLSAKTKKKKPVKKEHPLSRLGKQPDIASGYNQYKEFGGKQYTGMKVGKSHKWYYDKGEWKETKITPDLWSISYAVTKRRAGKAPEGSGAAVGTAYHWYILAHQNVKKLNANNYSTSLTGLKYKLAHKRATADKWSAGTPTQRKHLIKFLKEMVEQLEKAPIPLALEYKDKTYKGEAIPIAETFHEGQFDEFDITLNDEHLGIIRRMKNSWKMELIDDKRLINAIGDELTRQF